MAEKRQQDRQTSLTQRLLGHLTRRPFSTALPDGRGGIPASAALADSADGTLDRPSLANASGVVAAISETVLPTTRTVRRGVLHLGEFRTWLPDDAGLDVLVERGGVCWIGPDESAQPLASAPAVYWTRAKLGAHDRVFLDWRARIWLDVEDDNHFEALVVPARTSGVLVVPLENPNRRIGVAS